MLTPPGPHYLEQLRHSHESHLRVRLHSGGALVGDLLPEAVNLTIDGKAEVWRTADINVGVDFWESETREFLEAANVQTGEITIEHGISYESSVASIQWVKLATLRIDAMNMTLLAAGRNITAMDRAMLVSEFQIVDDRPLNKPYVQMIEDLLDETIPGANFMVGAGVSLTKAPAPGKSISKGSNRLSEIVAMADVLSARFYNDPLGRFRLDFFDPTATPLTVWDVNDGPEGVLLSMTQSFSRAEQYNALGITYTPDTDDADWVSHVVYVHDDDPTSPTFYNGPFGRKNIFFEEEYDHLPSVAEADALAYRKLAEYTGATRGLAIDAVYNPLLQPGDHIAVTFPETGEVESHIVERITLTLGTAANMQIETRLKRDTTGFAIFHDSYPKSVPVEPVVLDVPPRYLERV
jgi:hypothetical protein